MSWKHTASWIFIIVVFVVCIINIWEAMVETIKFTWRLSR